MKLHRAVHNEMFELGEIVGYYCVVSSVCLSVTVSSVYLFCRHIITYVLCDLFNCLSSDVCGQGEAPWMCESSNR